MIKKRIKSPLLYILFIICALGLPARAYADEAAYAGQALSRVKSVRYSVSGGVETFTVNIERYGDVGSFFLAEPARFVVDVKGVRLPDGQHTMEVGSNCIQRVRYGNFDAQTARFVIDLSISSEFTVKKGKGYIKIETFSGAAGVDPIISVPVFSISSASQAIEKNDPNADAGTAPSNPAASQRPLRTPRPTRIPRPTPTPTPARQATPRRTPQGTPPASPEPTPEMPATPPPIMPKEEIRLDIASDLRIIVSAKDGNTLTVMTPKGAASKAVVTESKEALRISADIPYQEIPGLSGVKVFHINSDVIKSVGISQPELKFVRISFEIRNRVGVKLSKAESQLVFKLTNLFIPNVGYYKNGERAFLTLYKTAITTIGEQPERFYELSQSGGGAAWTVSFDSKYSLAEAGSADIDDDLVKSVSIKREKGGTKLSITAKRKVKLVIFTKYIPDYNLTETTVSIVRPAEFPERIVVIDAGHGGHDTGAVALSGKFEKDFNIDIALKLKERLSQQKDVRIFLTRDGDYFVDLYERAQLANELNATLFVSIHANASTDNPDANGIETLYFPMAADENAFTAKKFAELTQRNLINQLKTTDRGIKDRPNLIVLRRTDMPAILVETAFVTNAGDITNLSRSAYRKSVAKAVADSVQQALKIY